jgi:hypothetical protein
MQLRKSSQNLELKKMASAIVLKTPGSMLKKNKLPYKQFCNTPKRQLIQNIPSK